MEVITRVVFFNGFQYSLTDKGIIIKKNMLTGKEEIIKMTKRKWYSYEELKEHMEKYNQETKEFKALPIWDSVIRSEK
jgi:heme oxygenase